MRPENGPCPRPEAPWICGTIPRAPDLSIRGAWDSRGGKREMLTLTPGLGRRRPPIWPHRLPAAAAGGCASGGQRAVRRRRRPSMHATRDHGSVIAFAARSVPRPTISGDTDHGSPRPARHRGGAGACRRGLHRGLLPQGLRGLPGPASTATSPGISAIASKGGETDGDHHHHDGGPALCDARPKRDIPVAGRLPSGLPGTGSSSLARPPRMTGPRSQKECWRVRASSMPSPAVPTAP